MRLRAFIFLFFFLSTLSSAGERNRVSLSLAPFLSGGLMGIMDFASSSLAYNGPLAGMGLCFSAQGKKVDCFADAAFSYGWLGNSYRRHPAPMRNQQVDFSIGGLIRIYGNNTITVKTGCSLGLTGNRHYNLSFNDRFSFAFDTKACMSAELMLPRRFSVLVEERIPFVAFLWVFDNIKYDVPTILPDYSLKTVPGNDFRLVICRSLRSGNGLMLGLRHYCYSTGKALPDRFQIQLLEVGLAFRFGLTKS